MPKSVVTALQARYAKTLKHCWDKAYSLVREHRRASRTSPASWRWWTRSGVKNRYRLGSNATSTAQRNTWRGKIRKASNYEVTVSSVHRTTAPAGFDQPLTSWAAIPPTTFTTHWESGDPSFSKHSQAIEETLDCDKNYSSSDKTAVVTLTKASSENTITAFINPKLADFPDDPLAPLGVHPAAWVWIQYDV